jgi:hypothetical protein
VDPGPPQGQSPRSLLGGWALPKPRPNKEGQGSRAHGFPLPIWPLGGPTPTPKKHERSHWESPRLTCSPHETGKSPRHGNGRLCCTTTPRSSHISRRQLMYIKEKNTSLFLSRKLKKSDKNWLRKLRSKSTSWGRNMRAAASPLAGRFLSVLSVPSRLSGPEHDQQCLAQAPPNVNRP